MKKILATILALVLVLSLCVVPASATEPDCSVTVSSVTSVSESATEQTVQFTITIITKEAKPIKSFSFELDPSENLTLATSGKAADTFKYTTNKALKYDEEEGTGIFNTYAYNGTTKVLAAYGAVGDGITSETVVLTIMGKIAANATGSATLGLKDVVVGPDGSSQYKNVSTTGATITINAAPVALTGTATITGTAKYGQTLTAGLTGGNNTGTLSYQWYRGNDVISGATAKTYTLGADDIGKAIKVEISSSVQTGSVTSTATSAVAKADAPSAPSCTFSFDGTNAGKLMGSTASMEYSLNGGSSWTACTANMALPVANITADKDIKVRLKETATANAGAIQTIDITKAVTPTSVNKTDCTTISNNNGTLTGVNSTMEYKKSTASSWTAISGTTVTGLASGTYNVRVKATGTKLASEPQTVTINAFNAQKEATPTATFTATGDSTGILTNVTSGMKYSTNGTTWTNITSTSVELTGLSAGTIQVYKPGNGTTTTDSDKQSITITKASKPNLTVTQPTTVGGTGSIATTAAHQFSTDGTNWTDCTGAKTGLAAGTYYVRVKAAGTTLASEAQTVTITEFKKTLTEINVTTAPTKTNYIAGQDFDSTGMVVTATYNDSSTKAVTGWTVKDGKNLTIGKTFVTISYTEGGETKTTTQEITVTSKAVSSITVKTQPEKTAYKAGETFDPTGMFLTVTYNDGNTEDITSGFNWTPAGALKVSDTYVTITYGGKTTRVNITVKSNGNKPYTPSHKSDSEDVIVIKDNSAEYNPETGAPVEGIGVAVLAVLGAAYVVSKKRK